MTARKVISVSANFYEFAKKMSTQLNVSMTDFLDDFFLKNCENLVEFSEKKVENHTKAAEELKQFVEFLQKSVKNYTQETESGVEFSGENAKSSTNEEKERSTNAPKSTVCSTIQNSNHSTISQNTQKILHGENPENCIFESKTAILTENDSNSSARKEGGVGGGVTLKDTVTNVPFVQGNVNKVNDNFLEKNQNQENENKRLPACEYWKKIEEEFLHYWVAIPSCMRLQDYEICKKIYNKIKKRICKPYFFCGVMKFFWETDWEFKMEQKFQKLPTAKEIFEKEIWKGLGKKIENKIENNRANYEKVLESRIAEFKGEK